MQTPSPEVEILKFTEYGTVLVIHVCCVNNFHGRVYFDVNKAILAVSTEGGYSVPEQRVAVRNIPE